MVQYNSSFSISLISLINREFNLIVIVFDRVQLPCQNISLFHHKIMTVSLLSFHSKLDGLSAYKIDALSSQK